MIKKIITVVIMSVVTMASYAQTDTISYTKQKGGYVFEYDGRPLKPKMMLDVVKYHPEAYNYMKKAKGNWGTGMFFAYVGGALIGWPLGTALAGGDPNWALAGVGAGFVLITIPLSKGYTKNAIKAADAYNASKNMSAMRDNHEWYLGVNAHGLTLSLKF